MVPALATVSEDPLMLGNGFGEPPVIASKHSDPSSAVRSGWALVIWYVRTCLMFGGRQVVLPLITESVVPIKHGSGVQKKSVC